MDLLPLPDDIKRYIFDIIIESRAVTLDPIHQELKHRINYEPVHSELRERFEELFIMTNISFIFNFPPGDEEEERMFRGADMVLQEMEMNNKKLYNILYDSRILNYLHYKMDDVSLEQHSEKAEEMVHDAYYYMETDDDEEEEE